MSSRKLARAPGNNAEKRLTKIIQLAARHHNGPPLSAVLATESLPLYSYSDLAVLPRRQVDSLPSQIMRAVSQELDATIGHERMADPFCAPLLEFFNGVRIGWPSHQHRRRECRLDEVAIPAPAWPGAFAMLNCVRTVATRTPESEAATLAEQNFAMLDHAITFSAVV
ncbi:hypothetical protein D3C76_1135230 [compost metagenome]